MKITVLFMQRRGGYPGEFAPEAMAVADEVTLDDNFDWWAEEVERQKKLVGKDAESWAEVDIEIDGAAVQAALNPKRIVTAGAVADDRP